MTRYDEESPVSQNSPDLSDSTMPVAGPVLPVRDKEEGHLANWAAKLATSHVYQDVEIREVGYTSSDAARLVEASITDLATRYQAQFADLGGKKTPGLYNEPSRFVPPQGSFFVAFLDGRPVGCGGWVSHGTSGEMAELKKMYVIPAARNRGIAGRILIASEQSAREHGRSEMILEVGTEQPEALAFYESRGYLLIENYGYFRDIPEVRSYAKSL